MIYMSLKVVVLSVKNEPSDGFTEVFQLKCICINCIFTNVSGL